MKAERLKESSRPPGTSPPRGRHPNTRAAFWKRASTPWSRSVPEGKITDVNEATVKVTGISRERLVGTDFSDYFTEPEKAREGYRKVFQEGFVTDYPLTICHTGGKLTSVLYNASVYRDAKGEHHGCLCGCAGRDRAEADGGRPSPGLSLFEKSSRGKP